ncbi:MAG: hypothetical protein JSS10_04075 [Verrucomicrobia bacterium]|nr:hypothetical protein [Verrucomicrobiota bacterium]
MGKVKRGELRGVYGDQTARAIIEVKVVQDIEGSRENAVGLKVRPSSRI